MDIRATPNTSHSYTAKTRSRWKRVICGPQNPHNNGQVADKAHAPFNYFITSNPVPETKGRNISQRHPLQKFSQQNAIEKIWINEDYYRKDPRNQIIISTETNHKPRQTWQWDDTSHIQTNFILVDESATHLPYVVSNISRLISLNNKRNTHRILIQAFGPRWAANLPAKNDANEWFAWVTLEKIFSLTTFFD